MATLRGTLRDNPGYRLRIVGHSLGGGTAAMLTMMLREVGGPLAEARWVEGRACKAAGRERGGGARAYGSVCGGGPLHPKRHFFS